MSETLYILAMIADRARPNTHERGRRSCEEGKQKRKNRGIFIHNNNPSDCVGQQLVYVVAADSSRRR